MKKYDFSQILEILNMCLRKKKTLLSALFIAQKQNILHFPLFFFLLQKRWRLYVLERVLRKSH